MMNLTQYQLKKKEQIQLQKAPRVRCLKCRRPKTACYCSQIQPFEPSLIFIILMHPLEAKRTIATGRMAHLCLSNSLLFRGLDFTNHDQVNAIIRNPRNFPMLLYPGATSTDFSHMKIENRRKLIPTNRQLVVFVIDGTWHTVKKIKLLSRNLDPLPLIQFTPEQPSRFHIRKQPHSHCYSTIEAIHQLITLIESNSSGIHNHLLDVLDFMVDRQMAHIKPRNQTSNLIP